MEPLTIYQQQVLERAVAKLVVLGERIGVSTEEMIQLLKAGLTVGELLEYLMSRTGEVA
ncbi:MAG TPA: hypothetical protein VL983_01630 [Terriglobales bacterium]|nr:hypothetical protein [Terriglobales bacterium]